MTRNEKELLLKDICARLPYDVKVDTTDNDGPLENVREALWYNTFTEDIKLINSIELDAEKIADISEIDVDSFEELQDFYHINHFDYRGLIPMGSAIDATGKNIY